MFFIPRIANMAMTKTIKAKIPITWVCCNPAALKQLALERGLEQDQVAYVGNDVNDLECLEWCGLGIAVADAEKAALAVADWVTTRKGGWGAVREVCDLLLARSSDRLGDADAPEAEGSADNLG